MNRSSLATLGILELAACQPVKDLQKRPEIVAALAFETGMAQVIADCTSEAEFDAASELQMLRDQVADSARFRTVDCELEKLDALSCDDHALRMQSGAEWLTPLHPRREGVSPYENEVYFSVNATSTSQHFVACE